MLRFWETLNAVGCLNHLLYSQVLTMYDWKTYMFEICFNLFLWMTNSISINSKEVYWSI